MTTTSLFGHVLAAQLPRIFFVAAARGSRRDNYEITRRCNYARGSLDAEFLKFLQLRRRIFN